MRDFVIIGVGILILAFLVFYGMAELLFPRAVLKFAEHVFLRALSRPFDRLSDWIDKKAGIERPVTAIERSREFREPSSRKILLARIWGVLHILMALLFFAALFGLFS